MKYELKNDDILYFLHIAKTGGTSFKKILDSQFNENVIFKPETWIELLLANNWDFSKSRLIRGHYGFGIHHILPKNPVYITMLREPTSRTISWYYFLMKAVKDGNPRLRKLFNGNESLFDLLLDPVFKRWFKNVQVRYLSLDLNLISLIQYFVEKENFSTRFDLSSYNSNYGSNTKINIPELELPFSKFTGRLYGQILDDFLNWPSIEGIDLDVSEEKLLEVAKMNLTKMPFFGILEQFDDSVFMLCETFGWKPVEEIPKERVGNYQKFDNFPEYVLKQIEQVTKLDSELYKFGKELFNKRLSGQIN